MKSFLKHILVFIPFTIIVYLLMIFIYGALVNQRYRYNLVYARGWGGHTFTRLQEVKNIKDVDILFLGSSHAYRGYDPRLFLNASFTSFNLGSSSQTPIQIELLLNRYLKQLNPKIVIIEVFPEIFTSDGVESSVDLIGNYKNDSESFKMAVKINNIKTYNTLLYAYMRELIFPNYLVNEPLQTEFDTYIPGGYVERRIKYFKHANYQNTEWVFNQKQLSSFEKVCAMLKSEQITFFLVYAPITPSLYRSYTNQNEFDKMISRYGDYYNFNEIIQLDDSIHFYDADHLNQLGVEIFNKSLIEKILYDEKQQ